MSSTLFSDYMICSHSLKFPCYSPYSGGHSTSPAGNGKEVAPGIKVSMFGQASDTLYKERNKDEDAINSNNFQRVRKA